MSTDLKISPAINMIMISTNQTIQNPTFICIISSHLLISSEKRKTKIQSPIYKCNKFSIHNVIQLDYFVDLNPIQIQLSNPTILSHSFTHSLKKKKKSSIVISNFSKPVSRKISLDPFCQSPRICIVLKPFISY